MSWIENVNTELVIYTGGMAIGAPGNTTGGFRPQWLNAQYVVEYNISEFVFKQLPGTLVKRGQPRGEVYDVEFYFQGADHLETAEAFKAAAADPRPWTIYHPYYGSLYVQPAGLRFDNSAHNTTKITGVVIRTLLDSGAQVSIAPPERIAAQMVAVNITVAARYAEDVPVMGVSDLQRLRQHIDGVYSAVSAKINSVQAYVTEFNNKYNQANGVLNTAIYDTLEIVGQAQNLISAPFDFLDTVVNRVAMFQVQMILFNRDVAAILALSNRPTRSLKRLYENNGASAMAGMCRATTTNVTDDYSYRPAVLSVIRSIVTNYNAYLVNLNALQSENGGEIDSYIPDADSLIALSELVNFTISTLFALSTDAKQERVYVVPYDTNIIALADLLYGNDENDTALQVLLDSNNIELEEQLILKQGREIVYYI